MGILVWVVIIGWVIFVIFSLVIVIKAFGESIVQGLLCLFIPFYILYYAFARLQSERKGFIVGVWLLALLSGPVADTLGVAFIGLKACTLLTKAEVEAVLGEPIEKPQPVPAPASLLGVSDFCGCKTVKTPPKVVLVGLEEKCPSLDPLLKRATAKPLSLSDVGDEAYWDGTALVARKGKACLFLAVRDQARAGGMSQAEIFQADKTLAQKAVTRLPR